MLFTRKYGSKTFESEQVTWFDNDGSLISLGDIPIDIFKKYELGLGSRVRIRKSNLGQG